MKQSNVCVAFSCTRFLQAHRFTFISDHAFNDSFGGTSDRHGVGGGARQDRAFRLEIITFPLLTDCPTTEDTLGQRGGQGSYERNSLGSLDSSISWAAYGHTRTRLNKPIVCDVLRSRNNNLPIVSSALNRSFFFTLLSIMSSPQKEISGICGFFFYFYFWSSTVCVFVVVVLCGQGAQFRQILWWGQN